MADRDALRELQSRLAERLQAVRREGVQVAWLAVEIAGARYLLPLAQSGEIFPLGTVQPVPYTQAWFLGVANLRGSLWGVIDLARFIGSTRTSAGTGTGSESASMHSDPLRGGGRIITLSAVLEVNCAVLIDRLAGLRGLDAFTASDRAPPGSPEWFGSSYTDSNGTSWQEINLQALSQQPQFLSISA